MKLLLLAASAIGLAVFEGCENRGVDTVDTVESEWFTFAGVSDKPAVDWYVYVRGEKIVRAEYCIIPPSAESPLDDAIRYPLECRDLGNGEYSLEGKVTFANWRDESLALRLRPEAEFDREPVEATITMIAPNKGESDTVVFRRVEKR